MHQGQPCDVRAHGLPARVRQGRWRMGVPPCADRRQERPHHGGRQHGQPGGARLGTALQRRDAQPALAGQDRLHLGEGRHPPPHQAHQDGHDDGPRQQPLPHADEPLRLLWIVPVQLARGPQRWREPSQPPRGHLCHRRQRHLRAVPTLRMGLGSYLLVRQGGLRS